MAIILTDVIVGEGLATPDQVRAALATCGKDESRLPSALAARGLLYGEKLEALYDLAACRASEDAAGAAAAKARLRNPPSPAGPPVPPPPEAVEAQKDPNRTLGPFTLLQEIGRGVHRAWRADPGRLFALQVFTAAGDDERARLAVQASAKLRHSRIVHFLDSGTVGGRTYLAMDLVDGRTLADGIRTEPLPWQKAAQAIADGALAVQFAHDQALVHRDLRPENVLLDPSGRAFLLNFGLARDSEDPAQAPPHYRSPEQVEGRLQDIDGRSDVYSLGCTLYHAVTGTPPFPFTDFGSFFDRMRTARPDPPSKKLPGLPSELDAVILRCLEKKPGDRYGRAFDLAVDLKRILRGLRPHTAPPAPPARRKAPETDEVTGLRSRRALLRQMPAVPLSAVLFDVDQIRTLSEREGRDGADLRLRKLAGLFSDLPGSGGVAARWGGDSFLCVLPGVGRTDATSFAERIRAAVLPIGITLSAGVADSVGGAQAALKQAKKAGRDRVVAAGPREADLSTVLPCRALLGRDAELAAAGNLLDAIRRGQPAMIMVEGDPGSGKTRLLGDISARARSSGVITLRTTCDDAKRGHPGVVLLSLIQEFFSSRESPRNALRDKLSKPQRYVLRDAVPCLRSWAPDLPAPDPREVPSHLAAALDAALRTMAAEAPILLVLDNAPACDGLTFTILRDLIRAGALPIGIALALKGQFSQLDEKSFDPALLGLWTEAGRRAAKLLRAAPLPLDQIEAMVCTILEGADLPDGFPERLAEASRGLPLYVETVLRNLGVRGKIGREQGGWKIEPLAPEDLPSSLDVAALQLSDALPPAAAELLGHAALLSAAIDVDALQALGTWREPEVLDLLDLLEERGLVTGGPGGTFAFAAGTFREVRLRAIPPARLPEMRAKMSQVLTDLYGMGFPEPPAPAPPPAAAPAPTPSPVAAPLSPAALDAAVRFIQAVTTELKMGRLYPKESRMRVEIRERLVETARELTSGSPRVTFALGPQGLKINDASLPATGEGPGRSLAQLFQEKSVVAMTLDRGATNAELFQFLDAMSAVVPKEAAADHWDRCKMTHLVLVPVRPAGVEAPAPVRPKPSDLEESAHATLTLPAAKLLSLDTEKTLPVLFNGLVEAKQQRLMEPVVDRLGAGLRDTETGLRRQAAALLTRVMDQGTPAVREILLRRLETPLAAAAGAETDDLTLALLGNAVRAWIATSTALKQHRLMATFASRLASAPDLLKRAPAMRSAVSITLASLGSIATEEITEVIAKSEPLREGAGRVAVLLGAPMVHPLISLILTHADVTVRRLAGATLKEIGDGWRQLAAQVKLDTPPHVVRNVLGVFEITGAGGPEVAALTRVAATHPDASVREAAGALLIRAKNLFTPILLSEILVRPEPVLQKAGIVAARDLKMREAGAGVLKIAETTHDEEILRAACNYFREVPSVEALPLLSKLFASRARAFGLLKGMSDSTRVAAIEALRKLNHPDAKRLVDKALGDGSETVRRAAKPPL